jgi:hypothetical protein
MHKQEHKAGRFITLRNDNCGAIRTRAQDQEADIESAMRDLEPGMNVAFKYEGTGNYVIGHVVSKPRVLTSRMSSIGMVRAS